MNKIGNLKKDLKQILNDPYNFAHKISINALVNILRSLSYHYYNTEKSLVPDEIYDILKDVLRERDPTNDYLKEIGAKISKIKVKLPYFMGSLDKIKPDTNALDNWKKKYKGPYVISDKLDGVSALFVKNKNKKLILYTRGDGYQGLDISYLIPYVFKNQIELSKLPVDIAIRGELIISKNNFNFIKNEFANGRNAVAGLVVSKNYSLKVAKITDFISYSVVHPRHTYIDQMKLLKKWNFPLVVHMIKKNINNDVLSKYLKMRREKSIYDIDGIVVADSSKTYELSNKNPSYAFAFKTILTDQIAEVIILDVLWSVTMYGLIKPRVIFKPINLAGVQIQYATAFNAKFVVDNKLGPGAIIKLIRSGDVIPHILEVLKPSASGKPKMPDIPYKWNDTKVDLIVKDIHGMCEDTVKIKKFAHFFKIMEVRYISIGIITKFVNNGYNSLIKIINANKMELSKIDGIGTKLVEKIYKNIESSFKNTTLYRLMAASLIFGRGLGIKKLKLITDSYPNIMNIKWNKQTLKNKIIAIDGFNEVTTSQFINNFDKFKNFFEKLSKVIEISYLKYPPKISKKKTNNLLNNKKIVFTGFRDKNLQKLIEDLGGKVTTSVSNSTDIVIYKNKASSKYLKAKKLGITLVQIDKFIKKYI